MTTKQSNKPLGRPMYRMMFGVICTCAGLVGLAGIYVDVVKNLLAAFAVYGIVYGLPTILIVVGVIVTLDAMRTKW